MVYFGKGDGEIKCQIKFSNNSNMRQPNYLRCGINKRESLRLGRLAHNILIGELISF